MLKWPILGAAVTTTLVIDQATKSWISGNLEMYQSIQPVPALAPFFQITRSANTGAAFGLLPMAGDLFLLLAIFIVAAMIWYFRGAPKGARLLPFAIGMVIGGAIGNGIDRVSYGHVVDFIHYQIPGLLSNVSNPADHAIVLGVILIIAESFWRERQQKSVGAGVAVSGVSDESDSAQNSNT